MEGIICLHDSLGSKMAFSDNLAFLLLFLSLLLVYLGSFVLPEGALAGVLEELGVSAWGFV